MGCEELSSLILGSTAPSAPLSGSACCSLSGVVCLSNSTSIFSLSLSYSALSPPSSLTSLPTLSLYPFLSSFSLSGCPPSSHFTLYTDTDLANVPLLQSFTAHGCGSNMMGVLPTFVNNPLLTDIYIVDLALTGTIPIELAYLQHLRTLSIYNLGLQGTIPEFTNANLTLLDITGNNLTGQLPSMSLCPLLQYFEAGSNPSLSSTLPSFSNNRALKSLLIPGSGLTGTIPSFINNTNLMFIFLSNNKFTGIDPYFISNNQVVSTIDLSYNSGLTIPPNILVRLSLIPSLQSGALILTGLPTYPPPVAPDPSSTTSSATTTTAATTTTSSTSSTATTTAGAASVIGTTSSPSSSKSIGSSSASPSATLPSVHVWILSCLTITLISVANRDRPHTK